MTFLAPLLAAATFVTGSATFVPADQSGSSSTKHGGSAQPHELGLGATFNPGVTGSGASIRCNDRIGVDSRVLMGAVEFEWPRPGILAAVCAVGRDHAEAAGHVFQRRHSPYVGGIWRAGTIPGRMRQLGLPAAGSGAAGVRRSRFGFAARMPFAISMEVIHYFQASSLVGTMAPAGTSFVVGVSLYK